MFQSFNLIDELNVEENIELPLTYLNIPKNHTKRELTNGYRIRRGAIDHNIPLITNARLASAFIEAFCELKLEDIAIKNWQEYK